jgi:hypothetical protein
MCKKRKWRWICVFIVGGTFLFENLASRWIDNLGLLRSFASFMVCGDRSRSSGVVVEI